MNEGNAGVIYPDAMLGLEREAGGETIRLAWRKAAKGAHPDAGGDADHFNRLQIAYELLQDPVRRRHAPRGPQGTNHTPPDSRPTPGHRSPVTRPTGL